mmetsp:Transcript_39304/g.71605  ORF Transcript_39304/g.71605 Transcript_39304/m.71605 type:complete len:90 (-) Transcript_39304:1252-1521(-)
MTTCKLPQVLFKSVREKAELMTASNDKNCNTSHPSHRFGQKSVGCFKIHDQPAKSTRWASQAMQITSQIDYTCKASEQCQPAHSTQTGV